MRKIILILILLPTTLIAQKKIIESGTVTYGAEKEVIPVMGDTIKKYYYGTKALKELKYRDQKFLYIKRFAWDRSGKIREIAKYPLDNLTYVFLTKYNDSERIELIASYDMGIVTGLFKQFYSNGQLFKEGTYDKGNLQGLWKFYNYEGKLVSEKVYKNNSLVSIKNY